MRFSLRTLLFVVTVLALIICIPYYLTRPDYVLHIVRGRELVNQTTFSSMSNECNQKERCKNGDEYWLYFFSTNGRDRGLVRPYMITVITIPAAEQFFKIEPFDYNRSRAIADPVAEFQTNLVWLNGYGPIESQDIWQIRNSMNHNDLRVVLERNNFKSLDP